jgi:chemotaxis protein MotA
MFVILGILIVIGAIAGGYVLEHGELLVLMQPAELLIILGAAIGTILIANPVPTVVRMAKGLAALFRADKRGKAFYLENLKMLNQLFGYARRVGIPKLEPDMDEPSKSPVFSRYPAFLKDEKAVYFICDTLRMFISGGVDPFELDQMMELDLEVLRREAHAPIAALTTTADALPGLGIVAAVLGVVITMGSLGGPPEEIGKKVAAALVGTFLGILMCYGFFGPVASRLARMNESEACFYHVMRVGILAFMKGSAPIMAVEFARRAIPSAVRPTFQETEKMCRGSRVETPAAAA